MMPNVPDENFASGGRGAVVVFSGNRSAFDRARPLTSFKFDGSTIVNCARYIAGSFRRGPEQWPVLGLRSLLEDASFLEASA